jgi:hypothetical protein
MEDMRSSTSSPVTFGFARRVGFMRGELILDFPHIGPPRRYFCSAMIRESSSLPRASETPALLALSARCAAGSA